MDDQDQITTPNIARNKQKNQTILLYCLVLLLPEDMNFSDDGTALIQEYYLN